MKLMQMVRSSLPYEIWKMGRAKYAQRLWGKPGQVLEVIGVTGTDGKTSTCMILEHMLRGLGATTMVVGTNGVKINGETIAGIQKMTSYDPSDLQRLLARAVDIGIDYVILEVSSHGLDQQRFDGIRFRAGVLTNISPEHLDYHPTMKHYVESKMKLFKKLTFAGRDAIAVLPQDDEYGKKRLKKFQFKTKISYGLSGSSKLQAKRIEYGTQSTSCQIERSAGSEPATFPLIGSFNLRNTLAAASVCLGLGYQLPDIIATMQTYQHASGRQSYIQLDGTHCYVDFAHTPQGLEAMLTTLQAIKGGDSGRIITLFGAPGQRDKGKRPEMAKIVEKYSDVIIVTDDDAAGENRRDILQGVMSGVCSQLGDQYYVIPHRRDAIRLACQIAQPGDYLLLAGKGHEKVLVTNYGKVDWDDEAVLKEERKNK